MTAKGWGGVGRGWRELSKKVKGLMNIENSVVLVEGMRVEGY